ncbi:VWA domain-containing protein, partial [Planctomycetota bacterium]
VKQALTDITGEDFGDSHAWRDYWKTVGGDFDPNKDRGDKEKSSTVLRPDEGSQFFKEKIVAKRIMFVIDVSGSMEAEDPPIEGQGGGKRIERVKNELLNTIKGLKGDVSFNVIAYSHVLKSWKKIGKGAPLHKASPGNKGNAVKWITGLKADGATHTDDALKKGFDVIEVNTIVLLSDGQPARMNAAKNGVDPIPAEEILKKVKGMNRLRGVKIHTFCFEVFKNDPGAQPLLDFMQKLAEDNGGKMTLVR